MAWPKLGERVHGAREIWVGRPMLSGDICCSPTSLKWEYSCAKHCYIFWFLCWFLSWLKQWYAPCNIFFDIFLCTMLFPEKSLYTYLCFHFKTWRGNLSWCCASILRIVAQWFLHNCSFYFLNFPAYELSHEFHVHWLRRALHVHIY